MPDALAIDRVKAPAMPPPAPEFRVLDSASEIPADDWRALFGDELEGRGYYRAVEEAGLPGFQWRYFSLWQGGRPIAVVPGFLTRYRLDTTITGGLKKLTERLARWLPGLMALDLLCLGSPVTEACHVGIDPIIPAERQEALLGLLLDGVEAFAAARRIGLLGIKDVPEACRLGRLGLRHGFTRMAGLPTAILPVDFADEAAYLARLSRATRKDIKRKLRQRPRLRVERRQRIDDVIGQVMALYEETWQRAELKLEHLTPEYFSAVLRNMPGHASCFLYWLDGRLVAFNLVLHDGKRMIDKFLGIDHGLARELNLYHITWMDDVRFCIEAGLGQYQSGQAFYDEKMRLGSRLIGNWLLFRHRSGWVNAILRLVARVARLDRFDPHIRALMEQNP